jgi:hypothetical protein
VTRIARFVRSAYESLLRAQVDRFSARAGKQVTARKNPIGLASTALEA